MIRSLTGVRTSEFICYVVQEDNTVDEVVDTK